MSNTVDNRVVELQFDNRQFESNVKTTMSTLDKLKQSLNFKGASKGLEDIQAVANRTDFSGMSRGIETVSASFSALQVVGITTLANLTNSAVNAGKNLVKSLSIDQITAGMNKYELKTQSVQTLVNSTGKSLDEINGYLDQLMWYSDETSYGFTDMTASLSQLTSAGGDIEKLIPMIEGVANATAFAGKGASEFSRVIYNLNQSYSAGYLQYTDWRSLELAGVASKQLKQTLIDTGVELGKIEKGQVSVANFSQTLKDKWADTQVIEAAFTKFSSLTQAAYEAVEAGKFETTSEAIEALSADYDELAVRAFTSAQEAKSFTEAIDATKDAVSSGWMKTAELIFGNYEEAKELWTDLANVLWDVFASGAEVRNALLESALGKTFTGLVENINGVLEPAMKMADSVTEVTTAVADLGAVVDDVILGKFGNGQERFDALTEAGHNWYRVQNEVNKELGCSKRYTEEQIAAQDKLLGVQTQTAKATGDTASATTSLTEAQKTQLKQLEKLSNEQLMAQGFTEDQIAALQELRDVAEKLNVPFDEFIDKLDEINGRWILIESFKDIGRAIASVFGAVSDALKDVFDPIQADEIFDLIVNIKSFTASLIPTEATLEKITRTFRGLFAAIELVTTILSAGFKLAIGVLSRLLGVAGSSILDVTALVGDMIYKFNEWFQNSVFIKFVETIVEGITKILDVVRDFVDQFKLDEKLAEGWAKIAEGAASLWTIVKAKLPKMSWPTVISNVLKLFGTRAGEVAIKISELLVQYKDWLTENTPLIGGLNKLAEIIKAVIDGIIDLVSTFIQLEPVQKFIEGIVDAFEKFFDKLGGIEVGANAFDTLLNAVKTTFTNINKWLETLGNSEQFGVDLVTGLVNGIISGIGMLLSAVINLATSIIETVCSVLGIQSPSTVMFDIGQNVVQGLINGIVSIVSTLWSVVSGLGSGIASWVTNGTSTLYNAGHSLFMGLWNGITTVWTAIKSFLSGVGHGIADVFSKIDWGVVTTIAGAVAAFVMLNKLLNIFDTFAGAVETLASPFKSLNDSIKNFSEGFKENMKAKAFKTRADAVKSLAVAIGIMAASIFLLTKIDEGDIWKALAAVGAMIVLMGALVGAVILLEKFSSFKATDVKGSLNAMAAIGKFAALFASIGVALGLLAVSMKVIATLTPAQMTQAALVVGGFIVLVGMLTTATKYAGNSVQIATTTKMIAKVGVALLLLAGAAKIFGTMTGDEFKMAAIAVGGFMTLITMLTLATEFIGKGSVQDFGKAMVSIAAAMGILALTAKLIGSMTWPEMQTATAGILGLSLVIIALMAATHLITGKRKNMLEVGKTLLAVAAAMGIMALVAKLISNMTWGEMAVAAAGIAGLGVLMGGLIWVTKFAGGKKLAGVAATLLATSACIGILAGVSVILGLVDPATMWKGVAAVGALSVIMGMLMWASGKSKGDLKGTMIGIAAAIGVMAAALVVLSFIKPEKLVGPVIAMSMLMTFFALVEYASKFVKKSVGTIVTMTVALGVMATALFILQNVDPQSAIGNATALMILMGTLSAALYVMGQTSRVAKRVIPGMAVLLAVLAATTVALKILDGVDPVGSIANAVALSVVLLALSGAITIIGNNKRNLTKALSGIAVLSAAVVMLSVALRILNGVDPFGSMGNALALGVLVLALAGAMTVLGTVSKSAITGAAAMVVMSVGLIAIAAALRLLKDIPFDQIMAGMLGLIGVILGLTVAAVVMSFFAAGAGALAIVLSVGAIAALAISVAFLIFSEALYTVGEALPMVADGLTALGTGVANFITAIADCAGRVGEFSSVMTTIGTSISNCLLIIAVGMIGAAAGAALLGGGFLVLAKGLVAVTTVVFPAALGIAALAGSIALLSLALVAGITLIALAIIAIVDVATGAGGDLVNGFVNGITGGLGSLIEAGASFVSTIASTICGLLGIQSPSTVAMGWGQNTAEGYAMGLENSTPVAESSASGFINAVKGIFSNDTSVSAALGAEGTEGANSFTSSLSNGLTGLDFSSMLGENGIDMSQFESMMQTEGTEGATNFGIGLTEGMGNLDLTSMLGENGLNMSQLESMMNTGGSDSATSFLSGFNSGVSSGELTNPTTGLLSNINASSGEFTAAGSSLMAAFNQGITDATGSSVSNMEALLQALLDAIDSFAEKFKTAMTTAVSDASSSISNSGYMSFFNAGLQCARGFANGIAFNSFLATIKARAMANAAVIAAKNALNINSPSKVFMKIGQGVPEGFAKGIDKYGYYVTNSIDTMATNALDNTKSVISRVGDALSNADMDSQPTIRPVVDLSEVEAGAANINSMFNSDLSLGARMNLNAISTSMRRRNQNGVNDDVVSAINNLRKDVGNLESNRYSLGDITFSAGDEVSRALTTLVNAARVEGRV